MQSANKYREEEGEGANAACCHTHDAKLLHLGRTVDKRDGHVVSGVNVLNRFRGRHGCYRVPQGLREEGKPVLAIRSRKLLVIHYRYTSD